MDENCGTVRAFWDLTSGILQKCTKWPQTELKEWDINKYLAYAFTRTVSLKCSSVLLSDQLFSRYCIFYYFPIDSHVKISQCHNIFKTWPIAKKSNRMYSTTVAILANVPWSWLKSDENHRGNSILELPAPYGPMLTKISNCHKTFQYFTERQIKVIGCILPWMKSVGVVHAFWKSEHRKCCKVYWMTPNWTYRSRHEKYPTYAVHRTASSKFSSISWYNQPFSRYSTFIPHWLPC